ncbi:hypothetical protein NP590_09360, partial [Methylomonas sp. SURF-2]
QVAKASNYWYAWPAMEIAYLCRMRLSEVLDLTDANELPEGLLIKRRKRSRDNIQFGILDGVLRGISQCLLGTGFWRNESNLIQSGQKIGALLSVSVQGIKLSLTA